MGSFELHPYQQDAIACAKERPFYYWAHFMGAGKTLASLTLIEQLIDAFEIRKALVVAPLQTAKHTWATEAEKFEHLRHLRISKVIGSQSERTTALAQRADIYVTNRENLAWLVKHLGKRWNFDMVVFDEASGLKDKTSLRWRAMRHIRAKVKRFLFLSGTPTSNGLEDLWGQFWLLDEACLGRTLTEFRERWFVPDQQNRKTRQVYSWKPTPAAEAEIHAAIAPFCHTLKAEDYQNLPRIDVVVPVDLPQKARQIYRTLERDLVLLCDSGVAITAPQAAVLSGKLRQVTSGNCYGEDRQVEKIHTAKIDALRELIEQANGEPVLVFYEYQHSADALATLGAEPLDVERWNRGAVPLMALHPASAGHGLNLQAGGAIVVWFDLTWSLELYQQANARLHRQGQQRPVRIYHLTATDTIDEDVMTALASKATTQDRLLEALKRRISQ